MLGVMRGTLTAARVVEISKPGFPILYRVETQRHAMPGWHRAGIFLSWTDASNCLDALVSEQNEQVTERIVSEWRA